LHDHAAYKEKKMALVSAISMSVVDDRGKSESVVVYVPADATLEEIQAFSNELVTALNSVTGGFIESSTVTINLSLPAGIRSGADADAFNTTGAILGFSAANTIYRQSIRIPAIVPNLVSGGEVVADHALLMAVRNLMISGNAATDPVDKYGNDINGFIGASMSFRTK
jgi:hypothetical protein